MKATNFKRFLCMALALVLCFGAVGTHGIVPHVHAADEYTGTGTFTQCTGTLESGYYVFGVGSSADSIAAVNTTAASNWIKFTTTKSSSGTITNPDSSIVWYYDATAGTFNNGTNYVAWPTTSNSAGLKTEGTPLTVTETTEGVYNITVTAIPARQLRLNGTSGYRFYTSSTGTNTFYFFKMEEPKHEHSYAWDGNVGTDGSHTLTCANTDGECDATTTTEECTWEDGFCSVCGAEAPECAHPTTTDVAEEPATCTEVGYTAGVQCTECHQYISGHEEIPAPGHTEVIDEAEPATCTETGLTEGKHCDVCEEVLVAQETTPAKGHNYVDGVCDVCDAVQPTTLTINRNSFGDASGYAWHGWTATTTKGDDISGSGFIYGGEKNSIQMNAKTATNGNYIYNTAALPGGITSIKVTAAKTTYRGFIVLTSDTPFDSSTNRLTAPEGSTATTVNQDGATWTFETNHKYFAIVLVDNGGAAYLSSIEITYKVCTHANKVAVGEPKDATCTEDGITAGEKCADCGEVLTPQETIYALEHIDENRDGYCDRDNCGEPMCTDHIWVGGEITKEPTCTETGLQEQYCEICETPGEDKVLDKIAHTEEIISAVEATCTATGLTEGKKCSVCDEILVAQEETPKADHNYVDGKCSVCGDIVVTGSQLADFQFGENGEDSYESTEAMPAENSFTDRGYTLQLTGCNGVYAARDAMGNAVLKLGTSSKAGSFTFTVDENVKTVVIYIAGRQTANAVIEVNGTAYTITSHSDEGNYTKIVVDTSTTKTVTLTTCSGGWRAMVNSIEFWGTEVGDAAGYTVTLGDNIGVNFYMELSETTLADETAHMLFTLPNGTKEKVYVKDVLDSATAGENVTYYKFTANIAVKEMSQEIKAQLFTAEGKTQEYPYTVKEYGMYVINNPGKYTENEVALAKAMLNYGAYAQVMFNYETGNLANSDMDEADKKLDGVTIDASVKNYTDDITGAAYLGTTTVWNANTSIRHYFTITGENITFTLCDAEGKFIKELEVMDGDYGKYVSIDGILAKDMATTYVLKVSDSTQELTITYSVYSYFYDILNGDYTDDEKNAVKAAYLYSQAAMTYLENK